MEKDYFIAPERLVTDDFIVRCYFPGDGPLLAAAQNASYAHLKTFMAWAKPHTTEEEAEQRVREWRAHYLLADNFGLGIFSPDEKRLLGSTGFHLRGVGLDHKAAEIGMWMRADVAGQGLGTAVLRALLDWGFTAWPWERLAWHCDGRNLASRCTAEKAGMQLEGVLRAHRLVDGVRRDTYCFAKIKELQVASWQVESCKLKVAS